MKITKKDCENKPKIHTENYLTKKKMKKENMEEIDIKMSGKNKQKPKEYQKNYRETKKIVVKNEF